MNLSKSMPSSKFVKLKEVVRVLSGKRTQVFKRSVADSASDSLCFSVITTERTVDFQAENQRERDMWMKTIDAMAQDVRRGVDFSTGRHDAGSPVSATDSTIIR